MYTSTYSTTKVLRPSKRTLSCLNRNQISVPIQKKADAEWERSDSNLGFNSWD